VTTTLPTRDVDAAVSEAKADADGHIARTDTKASILLGAIGATLAVLGTAGTSVTLPLAGGITAGFGAAVLMAAAGLLLSIIRPRLKPVAPGTLVHRATLTADQFREELTVDRRAEAAVTLSRLAVAKYERLQRAVDLTGVGGVLVVLAALIAIGGAL
jgi:hypothetical protein